MCYAPMPRAREIGSRSYFRSITTNGPSRCPAAAFLSRKVETGRSLCPLLRMGISATASSTVNGIPPMRFIGLSRCISGTAAVVLLPGCRGPRCSVAGVLAAKERGQFACQADQTSKLDANRTRLVRAVLGTKSNRIRDAFVLLLSTFHTQFEAYQTSLYVLFSQPRISGLQIFYCTLFA